MSTQRKTVIVTVSDRRYRVAFSDGQVLTLSSEVKPSQPGGLASWRRIYKQGGYVSQRTASVITYARSKAPCKAPSARAASLTIGQIPAAPALAAALRALLDSNDGYGRVRPEDEQRARAALAAYDGKVPA